MNSRAGIRIGAVLINLPNPFIDCLGQLSILLLALGETLLHLSSICDVSNDSQSACLAIELDTCTLDLRIECGAITAYVCGLARKVSLLLQFGRESLEDMTMVRVDQLGDLHAHQLRLGIAVHSAERCIGKQNRSLCLEYGQTVPQGIDELAVPQLAVLRCLLHWVLFDPILVLVLASRLLGIVRLF